MLALSLILAQPACARRPAHVSDSLELGASVPRRFAARLSIATDYAPCVEATDTTALVPRSTCDTTAGEPAAEIVDRVRHASQQLMRGPDVGALQATALVDLEWSADSGIALDRSISYLRTASELSPTPANSLADLSAAYLVRAERAQNVRDLLEAVEAASASLIEEPTNTAARFDRALALEKLGLDTQAQIEWAQYRAIDSTTEWGAEAGTHLAQLAAPNRSALAAGQHGHVSNSAPALPDPGQLASEAWNDVLGRWADAELAGDDASASRALREATTLSEELALAGGDRSVAAAVRTIRATLHDRSKRRALGRAQSAFSRAQRFNAAADYASALDWIERADTEQSPSPELRARIKLSLGAMLLYAGRLNKAERIVRTVRRTLDDVRDPALAGRADWILGTIALRAGKYQQAIEAYRGAVPYFVRTHEQENVGAVLSLVADAAFRVGDYDAGFAYTVRAADALASMPRSLWRHSVYSIAAMAAADENLRYAAISFADEGIAAADANGLPNYEVESRLTAARMYAAIHDTAAGEARLAAARSLMPRLPAGSPRRWAGAVLQMTAATLTRRRTDAIPLLDSAIATLSSPRNPLWLIPALLQRSDASFTLGLEDHARVDLENAVAELTRERGHITDLETRVSFLESARRAFDHEILIDAGRGDSTGALRTLEASRAAMRLHRMSTGLRLPRIEQGHAILDYTTIGDTVLVWGITPAQVAFTRTIIPHKRMSALLDAGTARQLGQSADAINSQLATLYDLLVRPTFDRDSALARSSDVTIIADGELATVPFAALYDRDTHSYVVERHVVHYAASLSEVSMTTWKVPHAARLALVVDPAFDRRRFPLLARLPGAQAEATTLARSRQNSIVITGAAATPQQLRRTLTHSAIVHYAGHALLDDRHPMNSVLVLAPDSSEADGALSAESISHMRLRNHPLVILSACETMHPSIGRSGDVSGLARGFLVAGAHGVLGSQWLLDDRKAAAFMTQFYDALETSEGAAQALQTAQISFIRSHDPARQSPSAWAAFRYAGT